MSESPNWSNPLRDSRDLRLPRIAGPCSLVIFGVTGDLAQKKLLPAVYDLANRGLLPPSFGLTGFARRDWTQERFIEFVKAAVQAHCRTPFKESTWRNLAAGIRFVQGTFDDPEAFERLSATVQELDRDRGMPSTCRCRRAHSHRSPSSWPPPACRARPRAHGAA